MVESFDVLLNGLVEKITDKQIDAIFNDGFAYEVVRVINNAPICFAEHFQRLSESSRELGLEHLISLEGLNEEVVLASKSTNSHQINVKVLLNRNHRLVMPIESHYPSIEDYRTGVTTSIFFAERQNPAYKLFQKQLRMNTGAFIKEKNVCEAVLVNGSNEITEGSKSNIFFIRDKNLYTAPDDVVLGGITRKKVMELARLLSIPVITNTIKISDLYSIDAAFITGTSPGILPIRQMDQWQFQVNHPILQALHIQYHQRYLYSYGL